jgi:RNA polymerase sigma-B factor
VTITMPDIMTETVSQPTTRTERASRTADLLDRIETCSDSHLKLRLTDELVTINMGVADAVVSHYRSRGVPIEDLRQVAYMALVKSAQNFDNSTGNNFLTYCVPTIRGEIRRYFRDQGWMVRPPRRIQELQQRLTATRSQLQFSLGREPSPQELADELGEDVADVREALQGDGCFSPASLDRPVGDETSSSLGELLPDDDDDRVSAEARVVLGPVVRRLGERDRRILMLRFFGGLTQQEIAEDIGVTQMQVSRLLSRIFGELREQLGLDDVESLLA